MHAPDPALALDALPDPVVVVGADGRVTATNEAARRSLGAITPGSPLRDLPLLDEEQRMLPPAHHPVALALRDGRPVERKLVGLVTAEGYRWYEAQAAPLLAVDPPRVAGAVATYHDVTAARQALQAVVRRAATDPLTGLANRRLLEQRMRQALARVGRRGGSVGLVLVDVDDFKGVNDRFGHPAGDALLVDVASRLVRLARTEDTVARLGGDEFALLIEDVDLEEALGVAERVADELARSYTVVRVDLPVEPTVSVGVAVTRGPEPDPDTLYRDADAALYRAKASRPVRVR